MNSPAVSTDARSERVNAQTIVIDAFAKDAKKYALSRDPRLRIEASQWEIFFNLPPDLLISVRDQAIANHENAPKQVEMALTVT